MEQCCNCSFRTRCRFRSHFHSHHPGRLRIRRCQWELVSILPTACIQFADTERSKNHLAGHTGYPVGNHWNTKVSMNSSLVTTPQLNHWGSSWGSKLNAIGSRRVPSAAIAGALIFVSFIEEDVGKVFRTEFIPAKRSRLMLTDYLQFCREIKTTDGSMGEAA